ncbi:MAG: class I SAM-dependent methyltransferase [Tissierellia bacterium]|nr:class I SAM-dependent methyltransferase [Tissierellia bacterium]
MNYKNFANLYDSFMDDIDYKLWAEFIDKKMGLKPWSNILELACGTGNLTQHLSDKYNILAMDNSQEMLNIAYSKFFTKKNIKTIKGDMKSFEFARKFDAAICACDSLNYIEPINVDTVFKNVSNHLKEGAKFIFDINSEYKLINICGNNFFSDENEYAVYFWQNELQLDKSRVIFHIDFFKKTEDDKYFRFSEEHIQYIHSVNSIVRALELNNFHNIEIKSDYKNVDYKKDSERITFIAERKKYD